MCSSPGRNKTWRLDRPGKKTAAAIHQEIAREVNQLLGRIFAQRRNSGGTDLEAIESALRVARHQAGASTLSELLQFEAPLPDQRQLPCAGGQQARYQELRSLNVLTVVGWVRMNRPWYFCDRCHEGQFPADKTLNVKGTDFSPGVRRMQALVGQEAPFDHGREQMKVLAGLEVTAKSEERPAEATGADIAANEQREIVRVVQLDLPVIAGKPIPILHVQMDGTGVPVVKKEAEGRKGKTDSDSRSGFNHLHRRYRDC